MRWPAIRIRIEHASNFVFNHIPHGVCYWGQSVDVAYTCLGLHKWSSFVTRSTLRAHCLSKTRWKLCRWWNFLWLRKWTDHWHTSVFYASGKMIISSKKVGRLQSLIWVSYNCAEGTEQGCLKIISREVMKRCHFCHFFVERTPWKLCRCWILSGNDCGLNDDRHYNAVVIPCQEKNG